MKKLISILAWIFCFGLPLMGWAQEAADARRFATLVKEAKGVVLDVRRPGELAKLGIVSGARHADYTSPDFDQRLAALKLDPAQPVYLYCHSGGRAMLTAQRLAKQGYRQVVWLDAMISELKDAGVKFDTWTGPQR